MTWGTRLPREKGLTLCRFRNHLDMQILEQDDNLWLKGGELQELRALPEATHFQILEDGQLLPLGHRVPLGYLPDGEWTLLRDWIQIQFETATLDGDLHRKVELRLIRTPIERESNLLILTWEEWHDYAVSAPQIRLNRLSFARSSEDRALVRGLPLPPLFGEHWVETCGIAVPAGWTWSPQIETTVIRDLLLFQEGELALLDSEGGWTLVREDDFVRASPSAVRETTRCR